MKLGDDRSRAGGNWKILTIWLGFTLLAGLLLILVLFTKVFDTSKQWEVPYLVWLLIAGVFLALLILLLCKATQILDAAQQNSTKLEAIAGALKQNSSILADVVQSVHLSDAAKTIVFGDAERQFLRQVVLDKLDQADSEAASKMIDKLARCEPYKQLAAQLRREIDNTQDTADDGHVDQAIARIEHLFEICDWIKANLEVDKLIETYPRNERACALRQKLSDKMDQRKHVLLNAWKDAVQRRATDRSLEILEELDQYLTPEEGLALQKTAKGIFRAKLYKLGTQFSMAVSRKSWDQAVALGEQITRDFPNSKMAQEIREKMDILRQKVELPGD
jgi:hypothetical protein